MDTLQNIIIAITSGAVVSIFNYFLTKDKEQRENRIKSYSSLLHNARAFLDDPNLSEKEKRDLKERFLQKYYNEIILFAKKDVRFEIENFIKTGGVSSTNPGVQITKLKNMISVIRKDIGSTEDGFDDFKMYSLEIEKK